MILKAKIFFCLSLLSVFISAPVFAQNSEGEITSFKSTIDLNKDGAVIVTEDISVDTAGIERHSIFREIPYKYNLPDGKTFNARVNFIEANGENGPWNIDDNYENNNLIIDIIKPNDGSFSGKNNFQIKYQADNVINFFKTHDEFYWNVNGNGWPIPTNEVVATVNLPKNITEKDLKTDCYTGPFGSSEKNCKWELIEANKIVFKTTKPLNSYENLTIVLGLPSGTIAPPPAIRKNLVGF